MVGSVRFQLQLQLGRTGWGQAMSKILYQIIRLRDDGDNSFTCVYLYVTISFPIAFPS